MDAVTPKVEPKPANTYGLLYPLAQVYSLYLDDRYLDDIHGFLPWLATSMYADQIEGMLSAVLTAAMEVESPQTPSGAHLALMADLIAANAYLVWSLATGNFTPACREVYERLQNPKPGDLVLEISSMIRNEPAISRLGWLINGVGKGGVADIRLLTGEVQHWENAMFIRVLESPFVR